MATAKKRAYDATKRLERADAERDASRERVVAAATALFLERGYQATTVGDIAKRAGVALQTVYNAGGSKLELLHRAVDVAVAGDTQDVMFTDRPEVAAIADDPDPRQQVARLATLIATTMERLAPIWQAYREAAATDDSARDYMVAAHRRRFETFGALIAGMDPQALRHSPEHSTDCMWSIGSIDVFLLFRDVQGWSFERYAEWLRTTLADLLLR
ncbi:MAG TPA: TetR/AcrR family transcriptional regulator [Actinomycetes bacterium]|nr:TetR/AcrR family transcriptional regulator [Actinomycetes bacterium]